MVIVDLDKKSAHKSKSTFQVHVVIRIQISYPAYDAIKILSITEEDCHGSPFFKGRHYYNQDALEKGWFTEARERSNRHLKKQKLRIHYREDDVGRLYYYDPCSREYMVFELCDYESYIADKVFFEEMIIYDEKTNAAKKKQQVKYQTGINRLRKGVKKCLRILKK
ncbi:MAG: hypothetical protein IKW90_12520 [Lachnospiraceae bacterium]|nr:hypothetical protein [Lachnospiraceae bacterium]